MMQAQDERALRIKVVGEQREIEVQLAGAEEGRAVFFVKFPLTPIYIPPKAIEQNKETKLFELKKGYEHAISKNLISKKVLEDPEQLSTVLGRVELLWESKTPTIVFYVAERENLGPEFEEFKEDRKNFEFFQISEEEYKSFKKKPEEEIAEATYAYYKKSELEGTELVVQCIHATQANNPFGSSRWKRLQGLCTAPAIIALNKLLIKCEKDPMPLPISPEDRMHHSISVLPNNSLFINEAANTRMPTDTDTCRSSTPSPK